MQTKPVIKQKITLVELPEDTDVFFQAVGVLQGNVEFGDDEISSTIGTKTYPLWCAKGYRKAFLALKRHIKKEGNYQRLIVYPNVLHFPNRDEPYKVSFQVVGFIKPDKVFADLKDFEFRLAGLWQSIPVCQTPVISVFKNFNEERLSFIREADVMQKVKFQKASHIPLIWSNALIKPFRFNPKLSKEEQGKAAFIQVNAKFLPESDTFEFVTLRSIPASNAPKYLKAGKFAKAAALKASQKPKAHSLKPNLHPKLKKPKIKPKQNNT